MARKNKNISKPEIGFGDYANTNNDVNNQENIDKKDNDNMNTNVKVDTKENYNVNENNDDNVDVNVNDNKVKKKSRIDAMIKEKKKDDKEMTGVYIRKDLLKILNSTGKKIGRGGKSQLVNDALEKYFEEEGLL